MISQRNRLKAISENVLQIEISAIKEMAILSAQVKDAVSLAWGLPSFQTPDYIRETVKQQLDLDRDIGKYTLPDGLKEFREQVAQRHQQETGVSVDADKNIMITAGNMEGLNILFHSILDPGDEVILTDPCFASHIQQIKLCGGQAIYWPLDEEKGWQVDLTLLPNLINHRTKAIVMVSPSNPTGKIFSKENLIKIGQLARDHGLLVIIDDPYSQFIYENNNHYFNLATVEEFSDHVIYLFTFSKCFAMSGWRLGYMILPEELKQQVLKVQDANIICAPRISQVAGMAALSQPPVHFEAFRNILSKRRELICQRLDNLPHVFEYVKPDGAYYVFPKILTEHSSSHDFAIQLLKQIKVTLTPGAAFGPSGEHHVRMAYCVSNDVINQAFDRMDKYFVP
ncbi:MAG: pyridoxal phosphate-dependent aminotransferase [Gammaproteobacteria bacterium]